MRPFLFAESDTMRTFFLAKKKILPYFCPNFEKPMSKPYIIGITGGSGSGKTSFLRRVAESFGRDEVCIISQDDYYRPRNEQQTDELGVKNFDLPQSIDKKAFHNDIARLIQGETIERQEYVFNNEKATPKTVSLQSAPIIIV